MNTRSELERIVSDWLADRVAEPPRGGLPTALERVKGTTRQRRGWLGRWLGRWSGGESTPDDRRQWSALAVSASVTIVTVVALGAVLIHRGDGDGWFPATSVGSTYVVAADGSGSHETIADAVAAAVDGDTILVRPGTYEEAFVIEADITLQGDGDRDEVIIRIPPDAPTVATHPDISNDMPTGIRLEASDATVRGLTVVGPDDAMAVLVWGGSPALEDLAIASDERSGRISGPVVLFIAGSTARLADSSTNGYVAVRDGAGPTMERNTFIAATLSVDGPGTTMVRGNTFLDGADISLTGAFGLVEANDLTGGSIGVDVGSDVTIQANTVRGHPDLPRVAIRVIDAGSRARITGSVVTDAPVGIEVASGATASIESNELTGNQVGVRILSGVATITANAIIDNGIGIQVVASPGETVIANNDLRSNRIALALSAGVEPTLSGNQLCQNDITVRPPGAIDLEGGESCPDDIPAASP